MSSPALHRPPPCSPHLCPSLLQALDVGKDADAWQFDPLLLKWVEKPNRDASADIDVTALALAHAEVDVSADILGMDGTEVD